MDQAAPVELWQLLPVRATGQAAKARTMEGERAGCGVWQEGGTARPFS